jgi:hypothetical protein
VKPTDTSFYPPAYVYVWRLIAEKEVNPAYPACQVRDLYRQHASELSLGELLEIDPSMIKLVLLFIT